ncbi:MAG: glycoside hydrolase family 95 protein [Melioribacteraceae bacterium]|nr:glycoside hydrolase family 95 protein [Melioribacteraceae bacterium]
MKKLQFTMGIIASIILISCQNQSDIKTKYKLWYNNPGEHFEEALVLGNGKMGATVFGGTETDIIYLNDATLWSGEPVDPNMNPNAHKYIPKIREALFEEDYKKADQLYKNIQGSFSQSFVPLGNLLIEHKHSANIENYYRELNISDAEALVNYKCDNAKFSKEYFVSNPDQVMVIRLKSDTDKVMNFDLNFTSLLKYKNETRDNSIIINGYAPYHTEPSYRGDLPDAVKFDKNRGIRFTAIIKIKSTDGNVLENDSTLSISEASAAEIIVSVATSFNGYDKDPAKDGLDNYAIAKEQLEKTNVKSFNELKFAHQKDYHSYFDRLTFQLQEKETVSLPTDERLKKYYTSGKSDKGLEELYFHFGRYLLISSSRTPNVPINLQGIWNPYMRPPWSSNYTTNINVEENYWLAETANLSELHKPLLGFIKNVSETGKITAKTFYGVDKGWTVAHNSDIWAMSNPVGDFGKGDPVWANWTMGGAWLSTHLWEHYIFTKDKEFLKNEAYPLMKGAADFCLNWLVEDKNGNLVTAPSTSPENLYKHDGYTGATLYGATADLAMIKELLIQTLRAAQILNIDEEFILTLVPILNKMYPYKVGKNGNLQEWYYDWEDQDPQHRHQSHLFGLYPGHHITPEKTPEFAEACKTTLNIKGDKSTGWSQGWRINLWARLKDGNRAYKLYQELLSYVDPTGMETNYSKGGGTYPNLLDAHPPFQIDGNFGGAAGVLEMLIQSTEFKIELLPALPDAWSSGKLSGVCARGGFELSFEWENKKITKCEISSKKVGKTNVFFNGKELQVKLNRGETKHIN